MVQAIPSGYAGVTPYLIVRGAARALEFYKKAFGATEVMRFPGPGGTIGHAEIKGGEGVVMLADESLEMGHKSSQTLGGTAVTLLFYVPDVDSQFAKAVAAGGTVNWDVPPRKPVGWFLAGAAAWALLLGSLARRRSRRTRTEPRTGREGPSGPRMQRAG